MSAFEEYGVMPELIASLEGELGWLLPTAVQAEVIPLALGGGDLLVAAETGAGKTGAFCLPIVQIVYESLRSITNAAEAAEAGQGQQQQGIHMSTWDHDSGLLVDADEGSTTTCECKTPNTWQGGRASHGVCQGKYAFEVAVVQGSSFCRVGWSCVTASLNLGTDAQGFGYGGAAKKSNASTFVDYGQQYGPGDVVSCLVDFDAGAFAFAKNGSELGRAFAIPAALKGMYFFPAILLKNCSVSVNFGANPFKFPIAGYHAIGNAADDDKKTAPEVLASSKNANKRTPLAIVLEPSKELAQQTFNELKRLQSHMPPPELRQILLVGGQSGKEQDDALEKGVDLIVATPGRLLELISKDKIDLTEVRFFVLDEADELVKQNSRSIIDLYQKIPKVSMRKRRLQVMFFSATLESQPVKHLINNITEYAVWVNLKGNVFVPDTVQHVVVHVNPSDYKLYEEALVAHSGEIETDGMHKNDKNVAAWLQTPGTKDTAALVAATPGGTLLPESISEIVKRMKGYHLISIIRKLSIDRAIIFGRTRLDCDNIEKYLRSQLKDLGAAPEDICVVLHSDRSNNERQANLERFKAGKSRFLVCTDVAARGIDVKGLPFIINFTLPDETANYVHRVGRVGRADHVGLAISIVATTPEKVWYHSNCKNANSCKDTRLSEQGGCAIYYDEPQMLKDIEKYIDAPLDELTAELEQILLDPKQRAIYGAKRVKTVVAVDSHAAEIAPRLANLTSLEDQAYSLYYALKNRSW